MTNFFVVDKGNENKIMENVKSYITLMYPYLTFTIISVLKDEIFIDAIQINNSITITINHFENIFEFNFTK